MVDEYRTRVMTLSDGTPIRAVLGGADADMSDAELLERYPRVAEILARWERDEVG
ncbi:hypothetical protein [Streptomyces sp. NPDC096339]|uniref:hypothetical protein n=1 Tax=Streptomyces sp. NPDC096339 TaxID=3366086 RepID=UPI0038233689